MYLFIEYSVKNLLSYQYIQSQWLIGVDGFLDLGRSAP